MYDFREYRDGCVLERLTELDRIVIFRMCWKDDDGNILTNRGYRVQFNNATGPYKGGLRFFCCEQMKRLKQLSLSSRNSATICSLTWGSVFHS